MQRREISKLKTRKKLWKLFNWDFPGNGLGFFRKNHSLNCGCELCKEKTKIRRAENKQQRAIGKLEMTKITKNYE